MLNCPYENNRLTGKAKNNPVGERYYILNLGGQTPEKKEKIATAGLKQMGLIGDFLKLFFSGKRL